MTPPCISPQVRETTVPSGICIGAANQRSIYNITHLLSVCFLTAFISSSGSTLSNNPRISNSSNQRYCQHLWRVAPTASNADLFGLYPYESDKKYGSTFGSNISF